MQDKRLKTIKTVIDILLMLLLLAYLLTGLGITEYRTVEALTSGLLTKQLSFEIHNNLLIPFVITLLVHMFFKPAVKLLTRGRRHTQ
jgi:hypothetical protein